ncbi:MAG TPA: hypothetical protein PKA05_06920 [Roseiflexaceae bacterium]|nr:hypothetical protein [Roseiflexaceae bacterium]
MSYEIHGAGCAVVVCDLCRARGAIGDRDWREGRPSASGGAQHLCRNCRQHAVWCEEHHAYHAPDSLHRCACKECGGLYTSVVKARINYCPSCLRQRPPAPIAVPQRSALQRALAHIFHHHS